MTLRDLYDLGVSWRAAPPVHKMVAAYLGYKPETPAKAPTRDDLEKLAAAFGRAG